LELLTDLEPGRDSGTETVPELAGQRPALQSVAQFMGSHKDTKKKGLTTTD
jgi:hypothetical protein